MSKFSHASAAQVAAVSLLLTAAVTGIPALADEMTIDSSETHVTASTGAVVIATDDFYAGRIVRDFQRIGATVPGSYANTTIDNSGFDFQAYLHDTCFNPTSADKNTCETRYGPYANLKSILMNGTLFGILKGAHIITDAQQSVITSVQLSVDPSFVPESQSGAVAPVTPTTPTTQTEEKSYDTIVRERSDFVWKMCKDQSKTYPQAARCYQSYQRLITRTEVPIDETLF